MVIAVQAPFFQVIGWFWFCRSKAAFIGARQKVHFVFSATRWLQCNGTIFGSEMAPVWSTLHLIDEVIFSWLAFILLKSCKRQHGIRRNFDGMFVQFSGYDVSTASIQNWLRSWNYLRINSEIRFLPEKSDINKRRCSPSIWYTWPSFDFGLSSLENPTLFLELVWRQTSLLQTNRSMACRCRLSLSHATRCSFRQNTQLKKLGNFSLSIVLSSPVPHIGERGGHKSLKLCVMLLVPFRSRWYHRLSSFMFWLFEIS